MKKFFRLFLSAMVSLIITIPAFAYPDVSADYWAAKQIENLTEKGVIVGYPDDSGTAGKIYRCRTFILGL